MESQALFLTRDQIERALRRLGEIAVSHGETIEVLVVGGAAMVLGYNARVSTRDVDGVFFEPPAAATIRAWIENVAIEYGIPGDWFNDAAKGFLVGLSRGKNLLSAPGIEVWQPLPEQLLAMKLAAWRDNRDINDARCLLLELIKSECCDEIWLRVEPFLVRGCELKSKLAFDDLWENIHDHSA